MASSHRILMYSIRREDSSDSLAAGRAFSSSCCFSGRHQTFRFTTENANGNRIPALLKERERIYHNLRMGKNRSFSGQAGFGTQSMPRVLELFTYLPDACVCVKDPQGIFRWANFAEAAFHGFERMEQLLGKSDFDLYEQRIAEQYAADDRRIMLAQAPSWNQVWLLSDHFQRLHWFVCSKVPLFEAGQASTGIAIVMRQLAQTRPIIPAYQGMEAVLSAVVNHHAEPVRMQALADLVHLSHSQFDRRFKQIFQQTPQQYVLRVRLNAACHALIHTEDSIAEIANRTGFSDQSHLTRQFRKEIQMTPLAYRRHYRNRVV